MMCCHVAAFAAPRGAPGYLLCDRAKTAVIGEDKPRIVTYKASLVPLLNNCGAVPQAFRPHRTKAKGKF